MCPYPYYQVIRLSKDKRQQRYQMVMYAKEHGIKPAARLFATGPKTVRKWVSRFKDGGYEALADLSRRPKHSPYTIPGDTAKHIVKLKAKYKRLGAEQVKILEEVSVSAKTIRKIWRDNRVSSRQRRKKHVTKQNLRAVKKQFALFERACEDTKDLCDIPEYWLQMRRLHLPKVQYTFREVSCGVQFLGFADDRSLIHATLSMDISKNMASCVPKEIARLIMALNIAVLGLLPSHQHTPLLLRQPDNNITPYRQVLIDGSLT